MKSLVAEKFFLPLTLTPLILCLALLFSNVRSPHELFTDSGIVKDKKKKAKAIAKVKETKVEEVIKSEPLKSLSDNLASSSKLGSDLKSLSAGLVSESSSGSGAGMNISEGNQDVGTMASQAGGENKPARATQVTTPVYPQSARSRGLSGYVLLELTINERGMISEVVILKSEPQGVFDQASIEAVKKWTFSPAMNEGKVVISKIKQKVNFELDN
jgi:TonB family protein